MSLNSRKTIEMNEYNNNSNWALFMSIIIKYYELNLHYI